jgi:transposase-like protein
MDNPAKKSAKSETDVVAEAKRKKDILDTVAQSNLPTKTILKELGISRSTYYSWLKRYEEEGMDGLMDSRSFTRAEEVEKEPAPTAEQVEAQPAAPAAPAEAAGAPEPVQETAEQPPIEAGKQVSDQAQETLGKEKEAKMAEEKAGFGDGEGRRGVGVYALVAIVVLVVGLLLSISLSNRNTYELRKSGDTLTLWKGKFAPRGSEMVDSFEPMVVANTDVSDLTGRDFRGKDAVYKAVFGHYMDQITAEEGKGDKADMARITTLLDKAEQIVTPSRGGLSNLAGPRFELAKKRVAIAELAVSKAYEKAIPVYEEALKNRLGEPAMLKEKLETMKASLGLTAGEEQEGPTEEAKAAAAPAKKEKAPEAAEPEVAAGEKS